MSHKRAKAVRVEARRHARDVQPWIDLWEEIKALSTAYLRARQDQPTNHSDVW